MGNNYLDFQTNEGVLDLKLELTDKVAVVTGGSRGIGKAIAERLLEEGSIVVIGSRTESEIQQTIEELSGMGTISGFPLNVADRESVKSFVYSTLQQTGRIDILVNSAGINLRLPAIDYPEHEWERILNINLNGAYRMCQEVGHHMIKQESGKIINITSMMSHTVTPNQAAYASSKAALAQYTKLLAVEWGKYHINVNAVSPGYIKTPLTEKAFDQTEYREKIVSQTPQQRLGLPEDIADAVVFLASDRARFIHGHVLAVDGGFLAGFPNIFAPTT